jgi:hypothetical protein
LRIAGLDVRRRGAGGTPSPLHFANLNGGQHFRTHLPYMLAPFAGLLLIICIPEISLTLPRLARLIR